MSVNDGSAAIWAADAYGFIRDQAGRLVQPAEFLGAKRQRDELVAAASAVVHELERGDAGEGNLAAIAWCRDALKRALKAAKVSQ